MDAQTLVNRCIRGAAALCMGLALHCVPETANAAASGSAARDDAAAKQTPSKKLTMIPRAVFQSKAEMTPELRERVRRIQTLARARLAHIGVAVSSANGTICMDESNVGYCDPGDHGGDFERVRWDDFEWGGDDWFSGGGGGFSPNKLEAITVTGNMGCWMELRGSFGTTLAECDAVSSLAGDPLLMA